MHNTLKKVISFMAILTVLLSALPFCVYANTDTESIINSTLLWKQKSCGVSTNTELTNCLADNPSSTSDWYVIALSRFQKNNTDFTKYLSKSSSTDNFVEKQRSAIAHICAGDKSINVNSLAEQTIGKLGIMSYAYGLIMIDCANIDTSYREKCIDEILNLKLSGGGWNLTGKYADIDTTAMVITALSPYYKKSEEVTSAIDKSLEILSKKQQNDGGYSSYGVPNCESSCQVLVALCSLGIDPKTDKRFIKNGNSVLYSILSYRLSDGSFSHSASQSSNEIATVQALYSLVALYRFENNDLPLFRLSNKSFAFGSNSKNEADSPSLKKNSPNNSEITETESNANNSKPEESQDEQINESINENDTPEQKAEINNNSSKPKKHDSGPNLKLYAYLIIITIFAAVLIYLIISRKFNRKNIILTLCIFTALCIALIPVKIQTPSQYYSENSSILNSEQKVYLEIRCDTVKETPNFEYSNGIILEKTEVAFSENESVFDILKRTTAQNKIPISFSGDKNNIYIKGISNISEFDFGGLSGWMYSVNDIAPSLSCSNYIVHNGDNIVFAYSLDMGNDIGINSESSINE